MSYVQNKRGRNKGKLLKVSHGVKVPCAKQSHKKSDPDKVKREVERIENMNNSSDEPYISISPYQRIKELDQRIEQFAVLGRSTLNLERQLACYKKIANQR